MILFLIYFLVGLIEYGRLSREYREKLYDDFPYHEKFYLETAIIVVCLIFGPTLVLMNMFFKTKQFFINLWKKITFPLRLIKFRKKLNQANEEKDAEKSVSMMFEAFREIMK